jgi:hypothetical protein
MTLVSKPAWNLWTAALFLASSWPIAAPIPAQEFRPLFDGVSLRGWHLQGHGEWKAANGMLVGTHLRADARFGHLVSDSAYRDFTLRYRWKLVQGNSGLYFRSEESGNAAGADDAGMIGPQVEMDEAYPGGIYSTNTDPWGWVVQPDPKDISKWYKPGEWNQVTVTAQGARVLITYNGLETAETSDARLPASGHFGFQLHAGLDCEILVDDVEIALPAPVTLVTPKRSGIRAERLPVPAGLWGDASETQSVRMFRVDGSRRPWARAILLGN